MDLTNAIKDLGVSDILEIKFFENRSNGQSKGFCSICVGSETSNRVLMDKLSRKEINTMIPMVSLPTKQALAQVSNVT